MEDDNMAYLGVVVLAILFIIGLLLLLLNKVLGILFFIGILVYVLFCTVRVAARKAKK